MNFDELKSRDVKDLRKLAAQYGIRVGGRAKPETIAKMIVEFIQNKPKQEMQHPAEKPAIQEAQLNTEEAVRHALGDLLNKPGFFAIFENNTWWFKYKGAEECGHMSVPLRLIKTKAMQVSRGAILPRGFLDKKLNASETSGIVMMT